MYADDNFLTSKSQKGILVQDMVNQLYQSKNYRIIDVKSVISKIIVAMVAE